MEKSVANEINKEIIKDIKKGLGIKSIIAFAKGAGFDTESIDSPCRIKDNKVILLIRGKYHYFTLKYGW